jgi:hypothetical protein
MTSPQNPETGLAPGLGQHQRVRFLTARVNPLRAAQTQRPNSGLHPSTVSDQQESRTVSPVNPTHHNPVPNPQPESPATATAPNPPGPNTQETHHDSIAAPPADTVTAPLTRRPPKPCSQPPRTCPAAYDHSPTAGPGRTPRRTQRRRPEQTKKLRVATAAAAHPGCRPGPAARPAHDPHRTSTPEEHRPLTGHPSHGATDPEGEGITTWQTRRSDSHPGDTSPPKTAKPPSPPGPGSMPAA